MMYLTGFVKLKPLIFIEYQKEHICAEIQLSRQAVKLVGNSVIGNNCKIGEFVKLDNCIVLDNAEIVEGSGIVRLHNSS